MANLKLFLLLFLLTFSTLYSQKQMNNKLMPKSVNYYQNLFNTDYESFNRRNVLFNKQLRKKTTNSRLTTNQVVDSVIVTDVQKTVKKYEYNYNSAGLYSSEIVEMRDETNTLFSNYRRNNFTYDSNWNMTTELNEEWNGVNWVNDFRYTYTYDSYGNVILYFWELWDETDWVNDHRYSYTYDPNGKRISEVFEYWYLTSWGNYSRYTYTYDINENINSAIYEEWDGTIWVNNYRYSFTYDSDGNMDTELFEDWDRTKANWVNNYKNHFSYNSDGNISVRLCEKWDETNWEVYDRDTYTYDNNGNKVSMLIEKWYGVWENVWHGDYTYDNNGNGTSFLSENWNGTNWILTNEDFPFEDMLGNYYSFNGTNVDIFYKTITDIRINEPSINSFILSQNYPNPFNPSTVISYQLPVLSRVSLKIYDLLGREVTTLVDKEMPAGIFEVIFNGSVLSSGVYLYKLQTNTFSQTKKLLLIK